MKTNLLKLFMMLFALSLFVTSCENVDLSEPEVDEETTEDNAIGERAVGDVFGYANTGQSGKKIEGTCPVYTMDQITHKLKIDFGTEGCTSNGAVRSGVILAQFTGPSWQAGILNTTTISFVNYIIDGKKLEGEIKVTMNSTDSGLQFNLIATNMKLTWIADGKFMTWNSDNTIVPGGSNNLIIKGTTTGVSRSGKTFVRTSEDLTTAIDCKWFVDGKMTLTVGTGDDTQIYIMTYKTPCGTVEFNYNGITFTRDLNE